MFDSVVDLDAELVAQGFEQGVERSQQLANEEVYCLGLTKGKELGVEIGFYRGVVRAFEGLLLQQSNAASSLETTNETSPSILDSETIRIVTKKFASPSTAQAWTALRKMVLEFPIDVPLSEENHDVMLAIRSKYKVLTTRLGIEPLWPSELGVSAAGSPTANPNGKNQSLSEGVAPTAANAHTLF